MGLFRKLGERVERFKQDAEAAAAQEADYACADCNERFYTGHEQCPECGSERVEPIEPAGDG